ncbi:hypothetical protein I5677_13185 [Mobilitalea sibirica]|uniref:Uncharacterized protein n=1 Tax=Mobilitalea sibirica TaxID=1462919 RepID=A0A8J7H3Z2_9FIRM|nr:hypothetical protein [Mobilitalea sibirica]MBH1941850.1 hypothetical protein [Mobilitalea sibirica]
MKNKLIDRIKRRRKWISIIYFILRLSVILIMLDQLRERNYENVFLCILTLILFFVPSFIEKKIHIDIPDTLETIILLFIFSAEILGEINSYYLIFPYWDTILHTLNGFLAAAIGFSLIDILNKNDRFAISLSPLFVALVAFCFSMTIGVVWEFFEYIMDTFFGTDMQKDTLLTSFRSVLLNPNGHNVPQKINIDSIIINNEPWKAYIDIGLIDTMMDLFVNFIGAFVFSVFGYFYIKRRGKSSFLKRFILRVYDEKE